ncbi:MAG: RimK-like protein [Thermoplasmatales archaeon A-plasma]|jgi:[lysine-biosynthesis-protein LysW]--L-2-aminoadipate ligase|nr:MAG: RimK-like protein [Thermoplasmatales archaeon A-plasma]
MTGLVKMVTVSILYDVLRWEEKELLKKASEMSISVVSVDIRKFSPALGDKCPKNLGDISIQRSVGFYRGLFSTAVLEHMNHRVVNTYRSLEITGNKMMTSLHLYQNGIRTPFTAFAFDEDAALRLFMERFNGEAVLKPITGSWGRMIALLKDKFAAQAVLHDRSLMHPIQSVYYFQEFVRKPGRDIRIIVAGEEIIAGMYRYQTGDEWRTNAAIGGRVEKLPKDSEIEELAIKSVSFLDTGIYGVDIMETDGGPVVNEINGTMEFRGTTAASGTDVASEMLKFVVKQEKC